MPPIHSFRPQSFAVALSGMLCVFTFCHPICDDDPGADERPAPPKLKEVCGIRFRECQPADAESTLTIVIKIRDLTTDTWTFPLRQISDDEPGQFDLPYGIATSHGLGATDEDDWFSTNISVYVADKSTPGVDVRISCWWRVGDKREGTVRRQLKVDHRIACVGRGRQDCGVVECHSPPTNGPCGTFWRTGRGQPPAMTLARNSRMSRP
jgi:hypothetical protein